MNYLLMVLLVISIIMAIVILIIFIGVLGAWMRGASVLAFPGLGLLVAAPLVLLALFVAETFVVLVAAYLVRFIPIMQLMFGEIDEF